MLISFPSVSLICRAIIADSVFPSVCLQPSVFVCENNRYGMGTPASRSSSNTLYYTRGDLIPGLQVNGMDVLAVMAAVKFSKEWTQSGKGPLILEMVTYRYGGHSMSDPGTTYRTREEIQHMRSANDPITGLKQRMLEWGIVTEDELKKIDKDVRKSVDDAVEEAKQSPEPEAFGDEMWKDSELTQLAAFCKLHFFFGGIHTD